MEKKIKIIVLISLIFFIVGCRNGLQDSNNEFSAENYEVTGTLFEQEETYIELSSNFSKNNEYDKAIQLLEYALSKEIQTSRIYAELGRTYYLKADIEKSEEIYNKLKEIRPLSPYPYILLGELYFQIGDYENAEKELKAALNIEAVDEFGNEYYHEYTYELLSNVYLAQENEEKAFDILKEGESKTPKELFDNIWGRYYQKISELDKSNIYFNNSLNNNPGDLNVMDEMAMNYLLLGKPEISKHYLLNIVEIEPENKNHYYNLFAFYVHFQRENINEIKDQIDTYISLFGDIDIGYALKALVLLHNDEIDEAREVLDIVKDSKGLYDITYLALGFLNYEEGDIESGYDYFIQALKTKRILTHQSLRTHNLELINEIMTKNQDKERLKELLNELIKTPELYNLPYDEGEEHFKMELSELLLILENGTNYVPGEIMLSKMTNTTTLYRKGD